MALEQVYVATPAVGGGGRIIASPFQFLFTGEDKLQLLIVNSLPGVTVQLATRFLERGMTTPQASAPTFTPTADRMVNSFDIVVGDGYLLNCSAIVVAGSPLVGQTYVMVRILRGASGATLMLGAMLGGYITGRQALAYPGSPIESSIAGGGYYRVVTGTQPAVGAELAETVPTGARWELVSLAAVLAVNNNVANRVPQLVIDAGATIYALSQEAGAVNGPFTATFGWARSVTKPTPPAGNDFGAQLPMDVVMLAGHRVRSTTQNLQGVDQWSAPTYLVREWLEAA